MSYGYDYDGYEGDAPYAADPDPQANAAAGRGRRRKATPEPQPESVSYDPTPYGQPPYEPQSYEHQSYEQPSYAPQSYAQQSYEQQRQGPYEPQWEHSGPGREQEAWNRAQRADDRYETQYIEPVREPAPVPAEYEAEPDSAWQAAAEHAPAGPEPISPAKVPSPAANRTVAGRGAFGAAGLAVVTGIGAIAATPVVAVIVGLSQIGLAVGWTRSAGLPHARRTVVLVAAVGLVAAVLAYRLIPDRAPAAMGAALGAGFVFLAADQLLRKDIAVQWPRSEALAAAVTGAAFTVLPAGYIVAQRGDSALAGACALAAAVAVLCSALVGGGVRPVGILAGAVAGTAVGTLTAASLGAAAGSKGGAMGGLISGIFAVVGARTADRLANEGSDVRISAQALPMAFSAIGAVIAVQVVR